MASTDFASPAIATRLLEPGLWQLDPPRERYRVPGCGAIVIDLYPETGDPDVRSEYYMKEVKLPKEGGTISNSYYDTPWHYSSPRQINVFFRIDYK